MGALCPFNACWLSEGSVPATLEVAGEVQRELVYIVLYREKLQHLVVKLCIWLLCIQSKTGKQKTGSNAM